MTQRFGKISLIIILVITAGMLSSCEMMIGLARLTAISERIAKIPGVEALNYRKEIKLFSDVMEMYRQRAYICVKSL